MRGRWKRHGDFFLSGYAGSHDVSFVDDSVSAAVTMLSIGWSEPAPLNTYAFVISFRFSPFAQDELIKICADFGIPVSKALSDINEAAGAPREKSDHIKKFHKNGSFYSCSISVADTPRSPTDKTLPQVMQFLDAVNLKFDMQAFPDEIKNEIRNCHSAVVEGNWLHYRHSIPESVNLSRVNRKKHGHTALTDVLYNDKNPYDKLKLLLLRGEDPNELDEFADTPLRLAIIRHMSHALIELLLWYKARPDLRVHESRYGMFCSALDTAKAYGRLDALDIIGAACTKPEKSPQVQNPWHVVKSDVSYADETIITTLECKNQETISTHYKMLGKLTLDERKEIYQQFVTTFEVPNDGSQAIIRDIFLNDFSGNKIIETICHGKKIIGFNLAEIIRFDDANDKVFLHCIYSALSPQYRNAGFMLHLIFRAAYSLQLLYDKKIGVFYSAIHINSYRLVEAIEEKHFPKHQAINNSDSMLVRKILDAIYQCDYVYFHHLVTCYTLDQLRVKGPRQSKKPSLNEKYYHKEILGLEEGGAEERETRGAPILFYVNRKNYENMLQNAASIGIRFDVNTLIFATFMQTCLIDMISLQSRASVNELIRRSNTLFGTRLRNADETTPASQSRAKL